MEYTSTLTWQRGQAAFTPKTYDRNHAIAFGSGQTVRGSSAPDYAGDDALVNPEELFTASISSCLMLTFLYLAALKGLTIEEYSATAVGKLAKNAEGKMAMSEVIITPKVVWENNTPDQSIVTELFKKAHDNCFISNSVKTTVSINI